MSHQSHSELAHKLAELITFVAVDHDAGLAPGDLPLVPEVVSLLGSVRVDTSFHTDLSNLRTELAAIVEAHERGSRSDRCFLYDNVKRLLDT